MFLLSINQKIIVKPITDNNGINSAQNLQTAALFVSGIGKIEAHIAQPTKKATFLMIPILISSCNIFLYNPDFLNFTDLNPSIPLLSNLLAIYPTASACCL